MPARLPLSLQRTYFDSMVTLFTEMVVSEMFAVSVSGDRHDAKSTV